MASRGVTHLPDQGVTAGPLVEHRPDSCPSCSAPWPPRAGHMRLTTVHCPCARHGTHRGHLCLTCGVETLAEPCTGQARGDVSGWTR